MSRLLPSPFCFNLPIARLQDVIQDDAFNCDLTYVALTLVTLQRLLDLNFSAMNFASSGWYTAESFVYFPSIRTCSWPPGHGMFMLSMPKPQPNLWMLPNAQELMMASANPICSKNRQNDKPSLKAEAVQEGQEHSISKQTI